MFQRSTVAILVALLCMPRVAAAQNTNDINTGIQLDFSLSGARSLGIGGAFVALADDATAVYGNPAGLIAITQKEVSGEFRNWHWVNTVPFSGHAYGPASGIGVDTVTGLVFKSFTSAASTPSFFAIVVPKTQWRYGAFGRVLTRYQIDRQTGSEFFDCRGEPTRPPFCEPHARADGIDRVYPQNEHIDIAIRSVGGSVAYAFGKTSKFSLGAGVQLAWLRMNATTTQFAAKDAKKFLPADFSEPANVELNIEQQGNDAALAANAGFLWQVTGKWSVGAALQQGPKLGFAAKTVTGAANVNGAGFVVADVADNPFKVPDHYAAGLVFRPNEEPRGVGIFPASWKVSGLWLISLEYDRVNFSQLIGDNYRNTQVTPDDPRGAVHQSGLRLDDSNRLRAGIEYDILRANGRQIAIRGGLFYDPQHASYFQPDNEETGFPAPRSALGGLKQHDQFHRSVGLGVKLQRIQFDFAADFARANTFAISTVVPLVRQP